MSENLDRQIKILYLSQYFPPEMGAPSARVFELSRYWAKVGHDVTVLTGFPHHPTGKVPNEYKQHIFKIERINKIKVVRSYVYPTENSGFVKRILSYFSFLISSVILGSWNIGKPQILIATSPQFFVAIAGYLISRIKHIPLILEIRDLWPESIVQLGQLKNKYIINKLEKIETYLYRKAKTIIVVADTSIKLISAKGISKSKIHLIKNGVDLNLFDPSKADQDLKRKFNLIDKFVISYIGTHGLSHALDKVLETAEILKNEKNIHFLLIGEGAEKQRLVSMSIKKSLKNVTFLDQINKNKLPYFYNLSDVILVTLRNLPLFQCVIPSKIFEIMAMAKPILLSVDGEARNLVVNEANAGIFVEPENSTLMAQKILNLYNNQINCKKLGKNGYNFVRTYYNRDRLAEEYLRIIDRYL
jgi:glycosyltransferase involved in cell wall biosynthesis